MKKWISLGLVVILCLALTPFVYADNSFSFSEMSEEEIKSVIRSGFHELCIRSTADNVVIYEDTKTGIKITISAIDFNDKTIVLTFKGTIINGSDEDITVKVAKLYVNNWKCGKYSHVYIGAPAGRNNKGDICETSRLKADADILSASDILTIEGEYEIEIGSMTINVPFTYEPNFE